MGKGLSELSLKQVITALVLEAPIISLEERRILIPKNDRSLRNLNEQTLKRLTCLTELGSLPFGSIMTFCSSSNLEYKYPIRVILWTFVFKGNFLSHKTYITLHNQSCVLST